MDNKEEFGVLDFGTLILRGRARLNLSRKQLVSRLGSRSESWLRKIESGEIAHPDDATIIALSKLLNIPLRQGLNARFAEALREEDYGDYVDAVCLAVLNPCSHNPVVAQPTTALSSSIDELRLRTKSARAFLGKHQYRKFGELTPDLLAEIELALDNVDEEYRSALLELLSRLYGMASFMLLKEQRPCVALVAACRATQFAERSGSRELAHQSQSLVVTVLLQSGEGKLARLLQGSSITN